MLFLFTAITCPKLSSLDVDVVLISFAVLYTNLLLTTFHLPSSLVSIQNFSLSLIPVSFTLALIESVLVNLAEINLLMYPVADDNCWNPVFGSQIIFEG